MALALTLLAAQLVLAPPPAAAKLAASSNEIRPRLIGQTVPEITLKSADGEDVRLHEVMARKQTVLIVYRGGWCYYCSRQLTQLRHIEQQLIDLGFQIVAISPDSPKKLKETQREKKLGVLFLSDPDGVAAGSLGLAYEAGFTDFGHPLAYAGAAKAAGSDRKLYLPVPGVFLASQKRIIFFSYVNVDFRIRLSAEVLLTAAKVYGSK